MERVISAIGLVVFVGLAYLFSVDRKAVRWRPVLWGIALQIFLAIFILKIPLGLAIFKALGDMVTQFLNFSDAGAQFLFGEGFEEHFIAFKVLPTIIFFSSFITILYHYGILQKVVEWVAVVMVRTMKTSGSETLSCSANIFVGQTEAPLLIKPYISTMTRSELHAVMTGGFATVAGGVLAAYISFGVPAEHLIAASVMSAPAALAISKVFYPETEVSPTAGQVKIEVKPTSANAIDAAAIGASEGMKLALNVAAMLIAFLGLLALVNGILGWVGTGIGVTQLSLEWIFSFVFAPVAWLMGVPWEDCRQVGILLGKKTFLNEFIAYLDLQRLIENSTSPEAGPTLSPRAILISTYALCGFSNIGSIAVQIGGISGMAPERQPDLARLGVPAMVAGSLACFMTACVAGMLS
ncbi:NupC/NupG family nucleoside CNT transporter [Lyngbya sp. CCY1209]|uniref:NupC/NupG family nucleoside CNT transporter n=1 Tax=Lyngbya sp. CCY1209 TaxID=2886103 RepID=UPI002D21475A|nr:NupC/NupG family nucleoside CNT transporter [Lyngbya sp. CCY1209]MEB3886934.1 NupC/NupG family nucleoside CNT transporter [Lyngbya sp. CCY1209]